MISTEEEAIKMMYCRKCKVQIHGSKSCCPLCNGEITGEPDNDIFPNVKQEKFNRNLAIRLLSFIAIVIIVLAFTINLIFFNGVWWALIITAATGCLWISASTAIIQRKHVFMAITWQLIFITGALVLWDLCIGWKRWSLDYVIPCACIISMLSMVIISKIVRVSPEEHLFYLVLDAVYGIVPVVFIFTGCLNTIYPSAVCVCSSIISIAAIILFEGKKIKEQIIKRFHF